MFLDLKKNGIMKQKEKRKKNSKKMSFSNSHINAYALN